MSLKPLFDRVVLKDAEIEETTKSGIVLTGGVLGLCAFVLIAIPDWKRDEKKKE